MLRSSGPTANTASALPHPNHVILGDVWRNSTANPMAPAGRPSRQHAASVQGVSHPLQPPISQVSRRPSTAFLQPPDHQPFRSQACNPQRFHTPKVARARTAAQASQLQFHGCQSCRHWHPAPPKPHMPDVANHDDPRTARTAQSKTAIT